MSGLASVGLTVLGGVLATVGGLIVVWRQHKHERRMERDRERQNALLELADALRPLLLELDRWVGPRSGDWVGSSRSLPELRTWVYDDESNASKALDWQAIAECAHGVERLWWGRLQTRIREASIREAYDKVSQAAYSLSRKDTADKRANAQHLLQCVRELLEAIERELSGAPIANPR